MQKRDGSRPPASISAIDKLVDLFAPYINSEIIISGDLNLNWLNSASHHLKEVCANINLSQAITDPTIPNIKDPSKPSLIDLILGLRSMNLVLVTAMWSDFIHVTKSVPQGLILGPVLFTLCNTDIITTVTVTFIFMQMTLFSTVFLILYIVQLNLFNTVLLTYKLHSVITNWFLMQIQPNL